MGLTTTKFDFVELINPFLSNVARLAFVKFLVLPSLVVDPGAQFGIDSPMGGNETVTMTVLVVFQLTKSLQPRSFMCVPAKSNRIQFFCA